MLNRLLLVGLLVCAAIYAMGDEADRRRADAEAKQAFLNLNFFSEGRGMHTSPGLINFYKKTAGLGVVVNTVKNRWGFNVVGESKIVGLFDEQYKGMNVAVLGCVACHSGRAAGNFIVGLGNKRIDVYQVGVDLLRVQKLYDKVNGDKGEDHKTVEQSAIAFASVLANENVKNLAQGLVPVTHVREWFYRQAGLELPKDITRGAVRVPALWGYGVKRKLGQFSDGYGVGSLPGWAIAVELVGGQIPETVRKYLPKVEGAEEALGHFLPPEYPFAVDQNKASQGRGVFARNCQGCHGSYERDTAGVPIFKEPRWIKIEAVGTDPDRLAANTPQFNELVRNSPLKDIIQINDFGRGYFAPRLEGVWARFPYLHNASVPNLTALLSAPSARPRLFALDDA
ncbi:MAG: hypothetical protein ABL958_20760, partial [Bdellovibrionia bacterium]